MDYNVNLIQSAWTIMNSPSSSSEQKKQADVYLTQFKQSSNFLSLTLELLLSPDTNLNVFAAFIIHQNIRDTIASLIDSKEHFTKIKLYLENDILFCLEESSAYPELVIQRICLSTAIMVLIGSVSYWPNCIEDLIQYANGSYIKCYYALTILSNANLDVSSISINQKDSQMIREKLSSKSQLIMSFITSIINTLPSIDNEDLKKKLHLRTIELVSTWAKYKMNILQMNSLCEMMLNQIKPDSIKEISEMFSDCISYSKSAKIYSFDKVSSIDDCVACTDKEELLSMTKIIEMIFNFVRNYINNVSNIEQEDIDDSLLIGIANIFASICENYLYLFFSKSTQSSQLLDVLLWFISLSKRKVSYKFFEAISEMREFINSSYKLSNLNDKEKKDFGFYLMKISEGVMINCKLKAIDRNYNNKLRNELLYISNPNLSSKNRQMEESVNEMENDSSEVSVVDYRRSAEDVFYNIFMILVRNYSTDGVMLFLSQIQKIIEYANINDESVTTDVNRLVAIEIVFFMMMAITESFESLEISSEPIVNFTKAILQSKLLSNQTMVMSFLLFIDKASPYIQSSKEVYHSTIHFLFQIMKEDRFYEDISSHFIFSIQMFIKDIDKDIFTLIYQFYNDNYSNLSKTVSINLTLSLCFTISVAQKGKKHCDGQGNEVNTVLTLNDLKQYYSLIMQPSKKMIEQLYNCFSNDKASVIMAQDAQKLVLIHNEISKNYSIQHNILLQSCIINKQLHNELFAFHFNSTLKTTGIIFKLFSDKSDLIRELTGIYIKHLEKLGDACIDYFNDLNQLMLSALNANCNNFNCLIVLKLLYTAYLNNQSDKNEEIANCFFLLCREQSKSVIANRDNRLEILKAYAHFFYFIFQKLQLTDSIILLHKVNLLDSILIFIEAILAYNDNYLLKTLINCLSCFIAHDSLPGEIVKEKYTDILMKVFSAMDAFNTTTIREFELFVSAAIGFDKELFLKAIQMIFTSNESIKALFNVQYAKLIIDYFNLFDEDDKKIHSLISCIVNIKQGNRTVDRLDYISIDIARKQSIQH